MREGKQSDVARQIQTSTRLERLIEGWTTDSKFVDSKKQPKTLNVVGARSEFSMLARRYGRDVTPRSLIDQLVRMRMASLEDKSISLNKDVHPRHADLQTVRSDLRLLLGLLDGFDLQTGRRTFSASRLCLGAPDPKTAHLLRRTSTSRIETALHAIRALSYDSTNRARPRKPHKNKVFIHVSIATETRRK